MAIGWSEWGDVAFARARAERKPILLSLTARWCHACHRMDEETWDHPGVASAVARATVPVRVDADARPDVSGRYHLGGLPTTALLTPDGDFVRGGTFLSPPQFFAFLEAALADFKAGSRPGPRPSRPSPSAPGNLVDEMITRLLRRVDAEHGGFGAAPKRPEIHALPLLLRRWRTSRDGRIERAVRGALDAIVDHLADPRDGGFFRYAAAADWTGLHTEKVAVDQAGVIRLLLEAGSALAEPRYLQLARQGLAHARRRLADDAGRVFASVAADAEYYAGARPADELPAVDQRRFADSGAAMVSAAWLGFAVTGEVPAFQAEFRAAAPAGSVPHRLDEPEGLGGLLQDQAFALEATLVEYRLSGDPELLQWAERAASFCIEHLWDEAAGAFRSAHDAGLAVKLPPVFPLVANGEIASGLIDLAAHTGRADHYRRYAERVVASLGPQALRSPAGPAVALAVQRLEDKSAEADLVGDPGDARAVELARVVIMALGPTAVLRWTAGAEPSVRLCVGNLCLPPIEDPRELSRSLIGLNSAPGGILVIQPQNEPKP
jgi:uncharacterized protein YyaL (SSP411 family)